MPMESTRAPDKILPVAWETFHRDARALARLLNDAGPFEALVAVTRGGMIPAAIVARELGLRMIETLCVASYDHAAQGAVNVIKGVSESCARQGGKGVLVVDDLADTGATLRVVRAMLPSAHIACVYAKPQGRPLVDTFIREVAQDTWIYFPWDTDAGLAFQPPVRDGAA